MILLDASTAASASAAGSPCVSTIDGLAVSLSATDAAAVRHTPRDPPARPAHRGARDEAGYFFALQVLVESAQSPPAFSQSALLVMVENLSAEDPPDDGLAAGDEDDPVDGVDIVPEPEPEPDVEPEPELLGVLPEPAPVVPLPLPPAAWAAATTGAKQIMPIKSSESVFFICLSSTAEHSVSAGGRDTAIFLPASRGRLTPKSAIRARRGPTVTHFLEPPHRRW